MILPVKFYTIECVVKDFNTYFSILEKSERDVKCLALILQLVAVLKTNKQNTPKPTPLVGLGEEGVKAKRALLAVTPGVKRRDNNRTKI